MALSRIKTWISGEVLTASDLNAEFNNYITNVSSLVTPITFNLTFTDATYDIGASGATRPRDLFLSRNLTNGSLTSGRVPYSSTAGLQVDSANLTFNGTTLTAHTLTVSTGALTVNGTGLNSLAGALKITGTNTGSIGALAGVIDYGNFAGMRLFSYGPDASTNGLFTLNSQRSDGSNSIDVLTSDAAGKVTLGGALFVSGVTTFTGTISVGNVTPTAAGITVGAASSNNCIWNASQGAGSATLYIGNASINVTSDERVKIGVRLWEGNASNLIRALPVKEWDGYLSNEPMGGYSGKYVGFTAQDMHAIAPWSVNMQGDTDLPWQARYEFLNGIIVKGWQEHDAEIFALKAWKAKAETALAAKGITI